MGSGETVGPRCRVGTNAWESVTKGSSQGCYPATPSRIYGHPSEHPALAEGRSIEELGSYGALYIPLV